MAIRAIERRVTYGEFEVRTQGTVTTVEGHAVVWDKMSQDLGGFVESVQRGACSKTIREADIRALQNHDENLVLGRTSSGTLDLAEDSTGLFYRIRMPDTSYANDLVKIMERGDVNQSSFGFMCLDDTWELMGDDYPHRTLREIRLVDVAPVTYPAYLDADAGIGRSAALAGLSKRSGVQVADLADLEALKRAIKPESTVDDAPGQTPTLDPKWQERVAYLGSIA
jgi:HK97 family phage prohead protease